MAKWLLMSPMTAFRAHALLTLSSSRSWPFCLCPSWLVKISLKLETYVQWSASGEIEVQFYGLWQLDIQLKILLLLSNWYTDWCSGGRRIIRDGVSPNALLRRSWQTFFLVLVLFTRCNKKPAFLKDFGFASKYLLGSFRHEWKEAPPPPSWHSTHTEGTKNERALFSAQKSFTFCIFGLFLALREQQPSSASSFNLVRPSANQPWRLFLALIPKRR